MHDAPGDLIGNSQMRSRFTQKEKQQILKEGRLKDGVKEVCVRHGISISTFYRWKAASALKHPHVRDHIRLLELENRQLKHKVAELSLDYNSLRSALVNERSSEC